MNPFERIDSAVARADRWARRQMARKVAPWPYVVLALSFGFWAGAAYPFANMVAAIERSRPAQNLGPLAPARPLPHFTEYELPTVGETRRPPMRMQGDARAVLEAIEPEAIESVCGPDTLACMRDVSHSPTVVMPNPCAFPWDPYAVLLCHELGHVNGWRHAEEGSL